MKKRKYYVEIVDFGFEYPEWKQEFSDLEKAFAYCKELNFQGHEFSILAVDEYEL